MLKNLTPAEFRCPPFPGCPGVFLKDDKVYLVGNKIDRIGEFAEIPVGEDEELIALPLELLKGVKFPKEKVKEEGC